MNGLSNPWSSFKGWAFGNGGTALNNDQYSSMIQDTPGGSALSNLAISNPTLHDQLSFGLPNTGGAFGSLANYGKSALKFGDQYGKGITEGLKAFSALKGMSNQKRQLKDARENADYLRKASNADISSRAEAQGTKRALQMGSSLEDAYKKGADYSNERMAQWGLK